MEEYTIELQPKKRQKKRKVIATNYFF